MNETIYSRSDTAGCFLKGKCIDYLKGKGIPYVDCGSEEDPDIESTRYPFLLLKLQVLCRKVKQNMEF